MIDDHYEEAQRRNQVSFPPPVTDRYFGLYATVKYARDIKMCAIEWYEWIAEQLVAELNGQEGKTAKPARPAKSSRS
jgi:hypothetical protein